MAQLTLDAGQTYACQTCGVRFVLPRNEAPSCCPVCRMNRVRAVDDG